ncbi:MAG: hypothetical protein Q4P13_03695 [Psychrobacter sp.]|nr:hypothetical protein [Psychrobacter sp.]
MTDPTMAHSYHTSSKLLPAMSSTSIDDEYVVVPTKSFKLSAGLTAVAAAMLLMQSNNVLAANPSIGNPAITEIENIAKSVYGVNGDKSIPLTANSNAVLVQSSSLQKFALVLTQPPVQTVPAGTTVNWVNVLTNSSYSDETVELTYRYPETLSNFKVYQDLNKNGIIDADDPLLPAQIQIGHGESIQIIVQALANESMKDGDTADIQIGAVVLEDPSVKAAATDSLIIVAPKIDFMDPAYGSVNNQDQVGKDVYIEASYAQCNFQPNARDQVWITITSPMTGDKYSLKAIETGVNTGKYRLEAPTQNNANAIDDAIIQTLEGDVLKATLQACIDPSVGLDEIPTNNDLNFLDNPIFTQLNMVDKLPNLQIEKEGDVRLADIGDYVNYSIKITNRGEATAYDVDLKDALPRGFSVVPDSVRIDGIKAPNFTSNGRYQVLGVGDLKSNESKKVSYRVLIGATAVGSDGINRANAVAVDSNGNTINSLESQWKVDVGRGLMNTDGIIIGKVYNDINRDGIQQKEDGELGVAGVRIYMENGNFVVTDPEGKYNFYGISAKTHVLKVDRTTLPADVELIEQTNRNAGDPGSRFVDLKYGELHRADFAIVDGMGDTSDRLTKRLIERSKSIDSQNDALEQAVKSELDLEPDYSISNDVVDASGCKSNDSLDERLSCEAVIVETTGDSNAKPISNIQVNQISQPPEILLEDILKKVADNNVKFLNLVDNQRLDSLKQLIQVQAPLGTDFTLYSNGKAVSEEKIGKRAEQQNQKVAGFDYYSVELNRGKNTLKAVAKDINGQVVSEQTIQVVTPVELQGIEYRTQDNLVAADGVSEYQVVVSLKDIDGQPYVASTPITVDTNIGRVNLKDISPDVPGTQILATGGELLIPVTAPNAPGQGQLVVTAGKTKQVIPLRFTPKLRPMIAAGIIEGSVSLTNFDASNITSADGYFEKELQELASSDDYSVNGRAAMFLKGKVRGDYLLTMSYDSDKSGERLFRDIEPGEYYPVYGDSSAKGFDAQSSSKLYVRLDKGRSYAMYGDIKTQVDGGDEGIKLGDYSRTLTGLKAQYEDDNTRVTAFAAETNSSQRVNETRGLGISGPYPLAEDFDAVLENSETVEILVRDADNPGIIISRERLSRFADYDIDLISRSLYLKAPIASQDLNGNPIYLRVTVEVDEGGEKYWVGGVNAKQQLTDKVAVGGSYVKSDDPLNNEELASANTVINFNERTKLIAEYARNKADNPNYQASNQINTSTLEGKDVKGDALRVELTYDDKARTRAKAYYNDADEGFVTGASPITAGRTESGAELEYKLGNDDKTRLKLEGVSTKDHTTDASREGIKAGVERQLSQNVVGELGVRYYKQEGAASRNIQGATDVNDTTNDTPFNDNVMNQSALNGIGSTDDMEGTTVRAKVTARLPDLNNSLIFAEYEQDIDHSNRNATSIGGETALGGFGRLYARHDLINSLSGSYGLDDTDERQRTVIGFDANYMKDGKVYSEYRMSDAISSREAEAAIGLKNKWYVQKGLTINTLFERIESLEGETDSTSTAAAIGAEYLANDNYKASGRLEKRWGETSDTLLASAGIAYRYNDEVTLLAKDIYSNVDYVDGHRTMNRFQVGAAYRDYDSNQLDMLSKLEYRLDDNLTGTSPYEKDAIIWSWHGNYHPTRPLTLSGHYAGKYTQYKADGIESDNTAHAAYARGMYDINERWDAGLQAGTYWNDKADDMAYMLGAEVGYSPMANLWLSLGYNFMGFTDEDIASDDTTQQGAYLRLRFKFDEDLFNNNDPRKNKRLLPAQDPEQTR